MEIAPDCFKFRRWGSPVTRYCASQVNAQAMILLSSGSSFTTRGISLSGKSRANLYKPAMSSSVELPHILIRRENFGLSKTWHNSSEILGLRQRVSLCSSANCSMACDGPNQSNPEMRTFISATMRMKIFSLCERGVFH